MAFIKKILKKFAKQKMLLFAKTDSNNRGRALLAEPVELDCRWEDKPVEVVTPDGRTIHAAGYILSSVDLPRGSLVWEGSLAQFKTLSTYPNVPTVNQGAREVLHVNRTPDLKAQEYLYEAYV